MVSKVYRDWRKTVLERDENICRRCGSRHDLQACHIKSYKNYPKLRLDVDNGITLCKKCHISLHKKYGRDCIEIFEEE